MTEPITFNVIVPTRERADTLLYCLRTITTQNYPQLRIIVSDNCSLDPTRQVVESFADPRITYINPGRRLSMAVHWEFALSHVTDGWVMFIGDDDGLCPGALERLNQLIQEHGVEVVNSAFGLFVWPGNLPELPAGKLIVPLNTSTMVKDSKRELARALAGFVPYFQLPWLYNGGAASLTLINAARAPDGRFFRSQIPDVYSAVAFCLKSDRFLSVAFPIAIGGTSRHSTGAAISIATNAEGQRAAAMFMLEENIPFHPDLIMGKSTEIFLYECYLQAKHLHPQVDAVSLGGQLQVALELAPAMHRESIVENCREMAQRHGLPSPRRLLRPLTRLRRLLPRLHRFYHRVVLDPTTLAVDNVHDAALAVRVVYGFATEGPLPLWLLLARSLPAQLTASLKGRLQRRRERRVQSQP